MNTVYKFMSFREEYFNDYYLKASRYGEFNDPFDLVLGEYGSSLSSEDAEEFYEAMPEHYKDPAYHIETYWDIQSGARASVSVICFTETYKSMLMWSHYAQNHEGVCVGFDYDCDFFHKRFNSNYSANVGKLNPVKYKKERPKYILPSDLVNDTSEWFTKSNDWKYEREHRILLPVDEAIEKTAKDTTILQYQIEPKYIKKVILGCRMNKKNKEYIKKRLSNYDIQIVEARPHPAHYILTFDAYEPNNSSQLNVAFNLGMDV